MTTASSPNNENSPPMSSGAGRFTVAMGLVIVIAGIFFYISQNIIKNNNQEVAQSIPGRGLEVGKTAPEIRANGWVNGEPPIDLSNKVIFVDAWASWCLPCRMEAPQLVETYQKFADREDVVFIGLTNEHEFALPAIKSYLEEENITWPNGYGAGQTLKAFQANRIPSMWVINKQGIITWNYESPEDLADAIQKALDD